jgi:hypothetical protein
LGEGSAPLELRIGADAESLVMELHGRFL